MTNKITLSDVASGYNLSKINSNFQAIQEELNNKVLYRNNPSGTDNTMQNDLDVNSKQIINLPKATLDSNPVRYAEFKEAAGELEELNAEVVEAISEVNTSIANLNGVIANEEAVYLQRISQLAFTRVVVNADFSDSATYTLTDPRQTIAYSGREYSWAGTFPKVVSCPTTPAATGGIGTGAWIDRTEDQLRDDLNSNASGYGGNIVKLENGNSLQTQILGMATRPLSYYGSDSTALTSLLGYAKASGSPIVLDADVTVTSQINIDFEGAVLKMYFNGFKIHSDIDCLILENLGRGSYIDKPDLVNITTPGVFSYWGSDGNWLSAANAALTVTESNDSGFAQPSDICPTEVQTAAAAYLSQSISPKLTIKTSEGVTVNQARGRYCLYYFWQCNECIMYEPEIEQGGKGIPYLGTIGFINIDNTSYGVGNWVIGGYVKYGTYSSVGFVRNKNGGVSDFLSYRAGESGIKYVQNNSDVTYYGVIRSRRCYSMSLSNCRSVQSRYDSYDIISDYGTSAERVDDYTLAQYSWNSLPSKHRVDNVVSVDPYATGFYCDGRYGVFNNLTVKEAGTQGIQCLAKNSVFNNATIIDANKLASSSVHQFNITGTNNVINNPTILTPTVAANGEAIHCVYSDTVVSGEYVAGNVTTVNVSGRKSIKVKKLTLGDGTTTTTTDIEFWPHQNTLTNFAGRIRNVLTNDVAGSESGYVQISGVSSGTVKTNGLTALPNGAGAVGVVGSDRTSADLPNWGNLFFRENSNKFVECVFLDSTGTAHTLTMNESVTASWTPGTIAAGASATLNVTFSGAILGNVFSASFSITLQGCIITVECVGAGSVNVIINNITSASVTLSAGTVKVTKHA